MPTYFQINKDAKTNVFIYTAFICITIVALLYGTSIAKTYNNVRVWHYENVLILLLGLPFVLLQSKAKLPNFFNKKVSLQQQFLTPFFIGVVFGILDIMVVKVIMDPQPYSELPPFLQPFPYSMFLYFSGAFEIEVFYRLIPITIALILGSWFAKGKYYSVFFTIIAVLTALREPLEQLPNGNTLLIVYSLITGFLMNYLQVIYFKKSGFLASLILRLGHYMFWHILLGIYVEYVELMHSH